MNVPVQPKINHIVHVDRLLTIIGDGCLWCDAEIDRRMPTGTVIGMGKIKKRRLQKPLSSFSNLHVGDCVPFYFCPRSVMLYMFQKNNHPEITYRGGQEPIIHLVADLRSVVQWAMENNRRWVFTDSNAGSFYFNDYANLNQLDQIDWNSVEARSWSGCREKKQAEFLIEKSFPWHLVEGIGVYSRAVFQQAVNALPVGGHRPQVKVKPEWYSDLTDKKLAKMIEYKSGDILREDAEALINTVNCVGVMGRGIALQFKKAFPANFKAYATACKNEEVRPGRMFVFETGQLTNPRFIINFPTKRHWRGKSRMEDIEAGLTALVDTIHHYNICSIAIPPLGSGLGGLEWSEVKPRIEKALNSLADVRVIIYEPKGAPVAGEIARNRDVPAMTAGRAALVELMNRYLGGLLDPFVTLLEVHKLMYFMQEAGEPLRLKYKQAPYGPYAENLRHVLNAIEGHLVAGYADGGDAPDKQLKLVPGAIEDAANFLQQHPDTRTRFDRVAELVEGFESPFGLDLLSTVHWILKKESVHSLDDVVHHTYAWNERKRQFTPRQIALATDVLTNKGWI